jgi:NADPH-dependent ferric siderophore reductase
LLQDGSRSPGLIDRLQTSPHDTQKVIETVAADSERKGMFEDSVRLYDLAKKHEKVIELLNKLLAQVSKSFLVIFVFAFGQRASQRSCRRRPRKTYLTRPLPLPLPD